MADLPFVSVVIPTYNRAELLRLAVQSVLEQTVPVWEIVVVDDGSTDHTSDVIRELIGQGAPLRYLPGAHENRRGPARNRGVAATSAPLIAFLDSDDLWLPQRLARQLAAWAARPEAGFAFCNVHRFDERGLIGPLPCLHPAADYNGAILGAMLEEPLAVPSTLIVRREAFAQVGGFADLPINEDYVLAVRLAAASPASYVPEVLVHMREHTNRTSHAYQEQSLTGYLRIVGEFLAAHPDLPPAVRAQGRRGLANVHAKLAQLYLGVGDKARARSHARALLALRPWDRRALTAWRAWAPV